MPHVTAAIRKITEWQSCSHVRPLTCDRCRSFLVPHVLEGRAGVVLACTKEGCKFTMPEVPPDVLTADLALCPATRPFTYAPA